MRFKAASQHACLSGGVLEPRAAQAARGSPGGYLEGWMKPGCKAEGNMVLWVVVRLGVCLPSLCASEESCRDWYGGVFFSQVQAQGLGTQV